MSTSLSNFYSYIIPHIKEPIVASMDKALIAAGRKFCKGTLLWKITLDRISVVADTQGYELETDEGDLVAVDTVKYKQDGEDDDQFKTLDPIENITEDLQRSGSWEFLESTSPDTYSVDNDNNLTLYPIPTAASVNGILVKIVVMPSIGATTLPDFIGADYMDEIAQGALAWLFNEKEDFLRRDRATASFSAAIASAQWQRRIGKTNRPLRVRFQKFV